MIEAGTIEFPWVSDLPKREKGKLAKVWDTLAELRATTEETGPLLPLTFAAALLNVSRQRIDQMMDAGKLERWELNGHPFVTERSVVAYAKAEKDKGGRPPVNLAGGMRAAVRYGREAASKD